jgi:hypothetical protein
MCSGFVNYVQRRADEPNLTAGGMAILLNSGDTTYPVSVALDWIDHYFR